MTSKERIHKILNFQRPDRIGINDFLLDSTIEGWRANGLPPETDPADYFGFDFEILKSDEVLLKGLPDAYRSDKFICISFSEPFQRLCDTLGRENVLRKIASQPREFHRGLIRETESILDLFEIIIDKGIVFDGIWAWGDLAYNKGPLFSLDTYRRLLFPLHKKIFRFFNERDIPAFFHSDGMIRDFIPYLLDAGVRAIHPFEEASGMDINRLLRDYKEKMVFMGCINIERSIRDKAALKEKIYTLKDNSSYIYHADSPIMPNIHLKDYRLAIEAVKECGSYL